MKRILTVIAATSVVWAGASQAEGPAPASLTFGEYGELEAALTSTPGNVENGRIIMSSRAKGNCIACHAVTDLEEFPFHGEVGPMLDGVGDRWSEAELRGIVADAKMTFTDSMMPSFYKNAGYTRPGDAFTGKAAQGELATLLTAQEIEDVVAYLLTLKES